MRRDAVLSQATRDDTEAFFRAPLQVFDEYGSPVWCARGVDNALRYPASLSRSLLTDAPNGGSYMYRISVSGDQLLLPNRGHRVNKEYHFQQYGSFIQNVT